MKNINLNVSCAGMDGHYKFSNVTFRDKAGRVVCRERLKQPQRPGDGRKKTRSGTDQLCHPMVHAFTA